MAQFAGEAAALVTAFLWAIATVVYGGVGQRIPSRELNLVKGTLALAMLLAISPLFVLPFAIWAGEKVTVRAALGALIALGGVALLFGFGG